MHGSRCAHSFSAPAITTLVAIPVSRSHSNTEGALQSYKYSIKSAGKLGISLSPAMEVWPKAYCVISSPKAQEPNVIALVAADGKALSLRPADSSSFTAWQKHLSEALVDLKAQQTLTVDGEEGRLDESTIAAALSYCSLLVPPSCPHMRRMQQVLSVRRETSAVLGRLKEAPKTVSLSDLTQLIRHSENEWLREVLWADCDFRFISRVVARLAAGEDVTAMCSVAAPERSAAPAAAIGSPLKRSVATSEGERSKDDHIITNKNVHNAILKDVPKLEKAPLENKENNNSSSSSSSDTVKRKALSPVRVGLALGATSGADPLSGATCVGQLDPVSALPIAAPAADSKPHRSSSVAAGRSAAAGGADASEHPTPQQAAPVSAAAAPAPARARTAPRPPPLMRPSVPPPTRALVAARWGEVLALLALMVAVSIAISALSLNLFSNSLISSIPNMEELHLVKGETLLASLAEAHRPLEAGESLLAARALAARALDGAPKFGSYYLVRVPIIKAAIKKILHIIAFIPNQIASFFFRM